MQLSSDLRGRRVEVFGEHPAEQLVVGEAVAFQDVLQRVLRRDEVLIDVGQPHLILVFQKSEPHVLLEKTAEIPGIQAGYARDLVDGDRAVIVLVRVVQDEVQTVQVLCPVVQVCLEDLYAEIVAELEQDLKKQAVEPQYIALRADVVCDLHLCERLLEDFQFGLADRIVARVVEDKPHAPSNQTQNSSPYRSPSAEGQCFLINSGVIHATKCTSPQHRYRVSDPI